MRPNDEYVTAEGRAPLKGMDTTLYESRPWWFPPRLWRRAFVAGLWTEIDYQNARNGGSS